MIFKQKRLVNELNDGKFYGMLNFIKIDEFRTFLYNIMELYRISPFNGHIGVMGHVLFTHYNVKIRPLYVIDDYRDRVDLLDLEIYKLEELSDYLTQQLDEGKIYMRELDDIKDFAGGL
jgi:hypothetical protein